MFDLDAIAEKWTTLIDNMDKYPLEYAFKVIKEYFPDNPQILELGCADGAMTRLLLNNYNDVTVIDGSKIALQRLKNNLGHKKVLSICSYFEDVQNLPYKYDIIIMGHILEHVADPVLILEKFKMFLNENGKIIIIVPNARSFHRMAAEKMGLLNSIYELNDTDIHVGHVRVYDFEKLSSDIIQSGLKIEKRDGYWLKFLSNKQIEEYFDLNTINAYFELGREYPENAAEIVVVCSK